MGGKQERGAELLDLCHRFERVRCDEECGGSETLASGFGV